MAWASARPTGEVTPRKSEWQLLIVALSDREIAPHMGLRGTDRSAESTAKLSRNNRSPSWKETCYDGIPLAIPRGTARLE